MNNTCTCPNYINDNIVNCTCGASFIKRLQETRNISNKQKYRKRHKRHKPLQVKSDLCDTLNKLNLLQDEIKNCISKIKYKVYRNKMFLCSSNMSYFVNIGKMIIKTINNIRFDLHFYNVRINLLYTTNIDHIENLYNKCLLKYKTCKEYIETLYVYKILKRNIKIRKTKIYKKKLETIYEYIIHLS
jgi:hypothetical protein